MIIIQLDSFYWGIWLIFVLFFGAGGQYGITSQQSYFQQQQEAFFFAKKPRIDPLLRTKQLE